MLSRTRDRRTVLTTLGAAVSGSAIIGQATAKRSPREIYEAGLEIREETGKREAFEQYILDHGFERDSQSVEVFPFEQSIDDVGIRRAESSDLTLAATVYSLADVSYAHGDWSVRNDTTDAWNDWSDLGKKPNDVVGIGWEHSDYDIKWNSWSSDQYSTQQIATTNNVAWQFDDYNAAIEYVQSDPVDSLFYGWVDAELDPTNPLSERSIIVSYQHTWVGGSVSGISFDSSGSMSISASLETKKWDSPKQAYSSDS